MLFVFYMSYILFSSVPPLLLSFAFNWFFLECIILILCHFLFFILLHYFHSGCPGNYNKSLKFIQSSVNESESDALEKEMATHSSVLAWRIPGTREAGGLPSMGLHRVGHDWSDLAAAAAAVWMNTSLTSVQFSCSVVSDSLRSLEPQHARPPCPSPTPRVHPNPCPLSRWCHSTILSSVIPFSSCPQSLPASGSFPMSQLFTSSGQSTGVSATTSALAMNTQD